METYTSVLPGVRHHVHFRDVRIWSNALLVSKRIADVQAVIDAVRSHGLLDPEDFDTLQQTPVNVPIKGFPQTVDVPDVATLRELLFENWLGERVLDAYGHLTMTTINTKKPNTILILPSIFHTQLTNAYRRSQLTTALKDLRESLLTSLPRFIAFVFNKDLSHWAPCVISTAGRVVHQGDSLRWDPDKKLLAMLEWFLGDITEVQGKWVDSYLDVPYQGSGSGSCGLVAFNAIQTFVDPDAKPWFDKQASDWRLDWMGLILKQHCTAVRCPTVVSL